MKQQTYSSLCYHLYNSNTDEKNSQQLALKPQSKSCKYCTKTMHPYHSSASLFQSSSANQFTTLSPKNKKNLSSPITFKQPNDSSPSILSATKKLLKDSESRRWSSISDNPYIDSNNSINSNSNSYDTGYESLQPHMLMSQSETQSQLDDKKIFLVPPPPPLPPLTGNQSENRSRIYSSSNESHLDDSLNNDCCTSFKPELKSPIANVNNQYYVNKDK